MERQTEGTKRYKWAHPSDWLWDKIRDYTTQQDVSALARLADDLAEKLDGDQIQDLFQSEMEADGYFRPLRGK